MNRTMFMKAPELGAKRVRNCFHILAAFTWASYFLRPIHAISTRKGYGYCVFLLKHWQNRQSCKFFTCEGVVDTELPHSQAMAALNYFIAL